MIYKKDIAILKKIYQHSNSFYNSEYGLWEYKIPSDITQSQLQALENIGLKPNHFETFYHDTTITQLLEFQNHAKVDLSFVTALFYKGITGEMPRARQSLMSFVYAKHLTEHSFVGDETCKICGLPKQQTLDRTETLHTNYLGHSWNELPLSFLIDLQEIVNFEKPIITNQDKEFLIRLLQVIEQASDNETPSELEKRLAKEKILPKTDKYKRYGILQTLAECGILPNPFLTPFWDNFYTCTESWEAHDKLKGSSRSDIILPLAGWRGRFGVNWERYREIFGED